jgi:hypothetical protein
VAPAACLRAAWAALWISKSKRSELKRKRKAGSNARPYVAMLVRRGTDLERRQLRALLLELAREFGEDNERPNAA